MPVFAAERVLLLGLSRDRSSTQTLSLNRQTNTDPPLAWSPAAWGGHGCGRGQAQSAAVRTAVCTPSLLFTRPPAVGGRPPRDPGDRGCPSGSGASRSASTPGHSSVPESGSPSVLNPHCDCQPGVRGHLPAQGAVARSCPEGLGDRGLEHSHGQTPVPRGSEMAARGEAPR